LRDQLEDERHEWRDRHLGRARDLGADFGARAPLSRGAVVVSDGSDTASDHSLGQARDALRRVDAFVYAIAIDSEEGARRASTR
jgi:hypothetical protein